METKKIYFLLTDTGTVLNRSIKLITNKPYNHISLSFDESLEKLYSFGRKKAYNPFIGGFVKEDINGPLFLNAKCVIYCLEIDEGSYQQIKYNIKHFENNSNVYNYDFLGLFGVLFNIKNQRRNTYFCSHFIAHILRSSNINVIEKDPFFTTPADFEQIPNIKLLYKGSLANYHNKKQTSPNKEKDSLGNQIIKLSFLKRIPIVSKLF